MRLPALRRDHFILIALCLVGFSLHSSSQTEREATRKGAQYVPTLTFDVASIRESKPDIEGGFRVGGEFQPANSSHLRLENNNFYNLLTWAYPTEVHHEIDGFQHLSRELRTALFDVTAEGDSAAEERLAKLPKELLRLEQEHMIQMLLAERFDLKVHWETRDSATYDLLVARRGRMASKAAAPSEEETKAWGDQGVPPLYQKGDSRFGFHYIAHGATSEDIAQMLAAQFGSPVNDKTGLNGKYYFDLRYYQTKASERADDETNPWPPLETAIRDQLGLKLVPSHGPVRFLVIDHAEMPSAN
jgi:uncharacterized protein (TIGR03435 family)